MRKRSLFSEIGVTGAALWIGALSIGGLVVVLGWPASGAAQSGSAESGSAQSGSAQTQIEKIRVGRHAGYDRIVIDLADELVAAYTSRDSGHLDISAEPPDLEPATRRLLGEIGVRVEPSAEGTQIRLEPNAARSWAAFLLAPEPGYENPRVVLDVGPRLPSAPTEARPIADRLAAERPASERPGVAGSVVEAPARAPVSAARPSEAARRVAPETVGEPEGRQPVKPSVEARKPEPTRPEREASTPAAPSQESVKPAVKAEAPARETRETRERVAAVEAGPREPVKAVGAGPREPVKAGVEVRRAEPSERSAPSAQEAAKAAPRSAPVATPGSSPSRQALEAQIKEDSLKVRISGIAFSGLPASGPSGEELLDVELPVVLTPDGDWRVAAGSPGVRLRELFSPGSGGAALHASVLQKIVERLAARYAESGKFGTIVDIHRASVESVMKSGGELVVHISEAPAGSE